MRLTEVQVRVLAALADGGQLRSAGRIVRPWWIAFDDDRHGFTVSRTTVAAIERRGYLRSGYEMLGSVRTLDITPAGRAALDKRGGE